MSRLILFDFDGTLTRKDTLLEFIKFFPGRRGFFSGLLYFSVVMFQYGIRLIKNDEAKQRVMRFFWSGNTLSEFQEKCNDFALNEIPKLVRKQAFEKLRNHQVAGDEIYIVSASPENWVELYCNSIGVKCIATRLQVLNGKITGNIDGKNCYGPEKVRRIKASINVESYSLIVAYGDSPGDNEMLRLANQSFYRVFK